ncbi:MAG: hydroxyacylglutathione hydrolase [Peptoniphilus sp.]|nr:hydroxyacylglutathione hydrolase [Peptoniphilus sp.]MDD7363309.1 hydroxyacylglutathione hydrolase [Bacillota bacterium]MDY6045261.1 hydroxyacylglutathione hydrolase [Peptoniphilus sp.]
MNIIPIPALADNYIWVIEKDRHITVVDPGEADLLLDLIDKKGWELDAVLLTHKHPDHIGGVEALTRAHPAPVYGPEETGLATRVVSGGEMFPLMGETVEVIATPGHTEGHVAFLIGKDLFPGDTLFLSSCGRVFSGDYDAMFRSLGILKRMDDDVKVYSAHEYSLSNLEQSVNYIDSDAVRDELARVRKLREEGAATLPTTIGKEKAVNPFFIIDNVEEFKKYREFRDRS